jgi:hypothetical protein
MRVQVDDARYQREPAGIEDLGRVLADLADRGDAAIVDRNVGTDRSCPSPSTTAAPRITRSCIGFSYGSSRFL